MVNTNLIGRAISNITRLSHLERETVMGPLRTAVAALRRGVGSEIDWQFAVSALNGGMKHTCHADGGSTPYPPMHLMCGRQWAIVPQAQRSEIWHYYEPGQEVTKRPTAEYRVAT